MNFWSQIDPLNDMMVWFFYNFLATDLFIIVLLLIRFTRGDRGWKIMRVIAVVNRVWLFVGNGLHVFVYYSVYDLYYFIGNQLFVIPFALFYHIQIKKALAEREKRNNDTPQ